MDLLSLIFDSAWITAIATLVTAFATYFVTKNNNRKDVAISDRMQLSKDQYQLIAELRQMMQEQRDELDNLKDEIRELQAVNINLTVENRQLQHKISELNIRLETFRKGSK